MTKKINKRVNKEKQNTVDKINSEIENYVQDQIDSQFDEYNTLNTIEDHLNTMIIDVDGLHFELSCELKKRLRQLYDCDLHSDKDDKSAKIKKYKNWIKILEQIDGIITSRDLNVLNNCISGYAAECYPNERYWEIKRNLNYMLNEWSDINRIDILEFDYKLNYIDEMLLFELTEILLEFESIFLCSYNPDNNQELSFSAFLYHWEQSGIDYIQEYEIFTELCWISSGLIKECWEADHVIILFFANGSYQSEYDYYFNQAYDNDHQNINSIDLGDFDCLCEDDLFQDTWLVAGREFPNYIDYFWDAEITDLFQDDNRDFYTKYRDGFSEDTWENYSKYWCMEGDSGFVFCKKENCEGCNHVNTKKVINPHYRLWKKYVEPIE